MTPMTDRQIAAARRAGKPYITQMGSEDGFVTVRIERGPPAKIVGHRPIITPIGRDWCELGWGFTSY